MHNNSINVPIKHYLAINLPRLWQSKWHPLVVLLSPLSYLYTLIVRTRFYAYKHNILSSSKAEKPIIVVGNVTVGGTGKTPLVIWLAQFLKEKGYRVGIVSRGYKGKTKSWPRQITDQDDAKMVGDEPKLLASRLNIPVVVDPDRVRAVNYLLANNAIDIVISDDGLQHYAMNRDIECIVVDSKIKFANHNLLPAGPLRQPLNLISDKALLVYSHYTETDEPIGKFNMHLKAIKFCNVLHRNKIIKTDEFSHKKINAIAAIGNPEKFFITLERLGLSVNRRAFPDHYEFTKSDLQFTNDYPIIMTEKDAIKCIDIADENTWYLYVDTIVNHDFRREIENTLEKLYVKETNS